MEATGMARFTAVVVLLLVAPCLAFDETPTREELQQKLTDLKERVQHLEAEQAALPDAASVARVVDQVIADAERRSQLLLKDDAVTGGFDLQKTKFFIRSADGNFLLVPGIFGQFRYEANVNTADDDDVQKGFEIRRFKLLYDGNVFTPDLQYKFQWETSSTSGNVSLQDAWIRYKFAEEWSFQLGQFKDIWNHEELTGDQFQLAVERSLQNALIGGGQTERIQGLMLMYDDKEKWRGVLLFTDGYNTDNTAFTKGGGTNFIGVIPTDFGFSGRLEYYAEGTRKWYDDFTSLKDKEDLLVFGGGASWSQGGDGDVIFHTVDVQFETADGLAIYGAYVADWRQIGDDEPVAAGDYYDWGVLLQSGYFFAEKLEGFARAGYTEIDEDALAAGVDNEVPELTVGMNYYWHNHNVKFTLDFVWLPNGSPINAPGAAIFAGDDDQFIFRSQLQLFI
jgi:hypothetical protein